MTGTLGNGSIPSVEVAGSVGDQLMLDSKPPLWRDDIDALEFQSGDHQGACIMHRRAFRTLLRATLSPQQCVDYYNSHQDAFQAAARAKVLRAGVVSNANFHIAGTWSDS